MRRRMPESFCHAPTCHKHIVTGRGVSNGGVSRSGLVLPFLCFLGLSRFFPGFSRFARGWSGDFPDSSLFSLFPPGLLRSPTRNSPERVRDTIWTFPEKSGKPPGLEPPRLSFSQFLLTVGAYLLTVKLLCLQSLKALTIKISTLHPSKNSEIINYAILGAHITSKYFWGICLCNGPVVCRNEILSRIIGQPRAWVIGSESWKRSIARKVSDGVGVDGVGAKFPLFLSGFCSFPVAEDWGTIDSNCLEMWRKH